MRGVLYRTEKDGTTLAVPELRISASNSRTVYYENNAAKQSALNNNEIREGSIVLTGLAGNNEDYATKAYVDSKIGNLEHQVGIIVGFPGNVPNGYLLCDGSRFDKNEYPELYEYLGTDVLPDYRECVLVGAGQNTTNSITTHDVYTVGQFKDDQIQNITGKIGTHGMGGGANIPFGVDYSGAFSFEDREYASPKIIMNDESRTRRNIVFNASLVARTGTTTHGKQKGLNWAIKAAPITISPSPIQYQEGDLLRLKQRVDWVNKIEITDTQLTAGYTAPNDGIVCISGHPSTGRGFVTINGIKIASGLASASNGDYREGQMQMVVNKGDVIQTISDSNSPLNWTSHLTPLFIPFKIISESTDSLMDVNDIYSLAEIKTNKIWIDGKPIYRKAGYKNNITTNTIYDSTLTTSYIDKPIQISGMNYNSNNGQYIESSGGVRVTSDGLKQITSISGDMYWSIEYTKKAD